MNEKRILKVGDVILCAGGYGGWEELKVDRVTATQATLSDGYKLRIEHWDGGGRIGESGYRSSNYYFDTPLRRAQMSVDIDRAYIVKHTIKVPRDGYGNVTLSGTACAQIVAIHKAAMVQISEIIKSETK